MNPTVKKAIVTARAGDRPFARRLLVQVVKSEPQNEMAWLWLSYLAGDPRESCQTLEHALRANPDSILVRAALARTQRESENGSAPTLPALAPSPPRNKEIIHFQEDGILISDRRAVFAESAFTTANIAGVSHVDDVSYQRRINDDLIRTGIVLTIGSAFAFNFVPDGGVLDAIATFLVIAGIIFLVIGWAGIPAKTTTHIVRIHLRRPGGDSREVDVVATRNHALAEKVIAALKRVLDAETAPRVQVRH